VKEASSGIDWYDLRAGWGEGVTEERWRAILGEGRGTAWDGEKEGVCEERAKGWCPELALELAAVEVGEVGEVGDTGLGREEESLAGECEEEGKFGLSRGLFLVQSQPERVNREKKRTHLILYTVLPSLCTLITPNSPSPCPCSS
jgi:hypothetical protein